MYDLIIIGAGPSGITASIYAARKKMNFLLLTDDVGGQTALSSDVENYTGYQFVTGLELVSKFEEHLKQFNIEVKKEEPVINIKQLDERKFLIETKKAAYEARAVIIASGRKPRWLNIDGEERLRNRGISYCATCDGPIFAKKTVAVIGGGNSALDATLQMANIAKHVYLININPVLGGDPVMREKAVNNSRVTVLNSAITKAVKGDNFVTGLVVEHEGVVKDIELQGVFVEIGSISNSGLIDFVVKNKGGEIVVDSFNRTSVPGIFAAGDVTDVPEKQIIIAAGEGAKALLAAFRYLMES